jgi:RNA polymerase sigma factor (sigma-70 family)
MSTTALSRYPAPAATLSTTELLTAAGEGDTAAWGEIVRRYGGLVAAKARSFRLQEADVHDAVQLTWLRLTENLHRLTFPERLGGWLATTASRECLRILRQAKLSAALVDLVPDDVTDPVAGPEQRAVEADLARAVQQVIAELPRSKQVIVRALFTENPRPYADVARSAGIPIGSIGPKRGRALRELGRMLDEHGWAPEG